MYDVRLPVIIYGEDAGVLMRREELEAFLRPGEGAAEDYQAEIELRDGRWIVSGVKRDA